MLSLTPIPLIASNSPYLSAALKRRLRLLPYYFSLLGIMRTGGICSHDRLPRSKRAETGSEISTWSLATYLLGASLLGSHLSTSAPTLLLLSPAAPDLCIRSDVSRRWVMFHSPPPNVRRGSPLVNVIGSSHPPTKFHSWAGNGKPIAHVGRAL